MVRGRPVVLPYGDAWALVCAVDRGCRVPDCKHEVFRLSVCEVKQRRDMSCGEYQEVSDATLFLSNEDGNPRFCPEDGVRTCASEIGAERTAVSFGELQR